ncbi:MAG TPA: thrombospondin type 3 repeat-containing protein [Pseudoduganella sp.]|jgi:hypothetical protein
MIRNAFIAAAAIAIGSAAFVPTQAVAQVGVNVIIGTPPPPVRWEAAPQPRRGYVWAPGYWDWNGHRHVWRGGQYLAERPGYAYAAPRWVEYGGRWRYEQARWNPYGPRGDLDRDGVPNRYDRDRDGDGRPNWVDRDANHYDRGYRDRGHDRYYNNDHGGHGYRGDGPRRDQDRDGVPNRYDRDRDGDGVPNRYDHRPENPYRR